MVVPYPLGRQPPRRLPPRGVVLTTMVSAAMPQSGYDGRTRETAVPGGKAMGTGEKDGVLRVRQMEVFRSDLEVGVRPECAGEGGSPGRRRFPFELGQPQTTQENRHTGFGKARTGGVVEAMARGVRVGLRKRPFTHTENELNTGLPGKTEWGGRAKPTRVEKDAECFGVETHGSKSKRHQSVGAYGGRRDAGMERKRCGGKPNLKAVIQLASSKGWCQEAGRKLKGKALARSTATSKQSKRAEILELTEAVTGSNCPFPITPQQLWEVAGALGEAGLRAGGQYLSELKAIQLEAGFEWPEHLERHLVGCKRALARDQGPEQRAVAVDPTELNSSRLLVVSRDRAGPKHPVMAYLWACVWMLRAAEAVEVLVEHIKFKPKGKIVQLVIPKSKTDQGGAGTLRTLSCCGLEVCEVACPFFLATVAMAQGSGRASGDPLFPTGRGTKPSKFGLIKAWTLHVAENMSGHSARRSGAMMYAKRGVPTCEIAFLGRWKSSAVFRYVEEALQSLPLNERVKLGVQGNVGKMVSQDAMSAEPSRAETARPDTALEATETEAPEKEVPEGKLLWAVSRSRKGRIYHAVRRATWDVRLEEWATACGWAFAARNTQVELTKQKPFGSRVCQKCTAVLAMRDGVKGGVAVAHVAQVTI